MKSLRLLMAEDSEDDAELILRELRRGGFEVAYHRVQTAEDMRDALARQTWDIILSDFSMPEFSAPGALAVRRASGLDIPLIIVSGTIGEDIAVRSLHAGAQDFILKGKLGRLLPAIERELREHEAREAHRQAEEALSASEARLKIRTEELHQREEMFRHLFEAAPDGILLVNSDGIISLANAEAERIFGYDGGALSGLLLDRLFPSDGHGNDALPPETFFANPERRRMGEGHDLRARRKDGVEFPVDMSFGPFVHEGRPIALGIVRDMTAQRNVEAQLRQAQKMEAVGRLAAGVAHDFNNILSVILSYAQMMEDDLTPEEPLRTSAMEIKAAGMRAVDLTRQLLTFSRQQVRVASVVDLDHTVAGMESMLRRLLGAHIKLTVLPGAGQWKVKVNPGELEQVVMNLAVNARDAMHEGGSLTIETKMVELDDEYARAHHEVVAGPYVMLAVSDTGTGIDKETQARIFEPFFTTKDMTKGTGLGLATVFGIVAQSAGHIWVYSEPGMGTTFRVYFPRTSGGPDAHPRDGDHFARRGRRPRACRRARDFEAERLRGSRGPERRGGPLDLRATQGEDSPLAHRRGAAENEREAARRASRERAARDADTLHVGVHGRCDLAARHSELGRRILAEADHARLAATKGA
jgi:two-component system cell cycle sensor histidine kinase/response regulator CckA